MKILFLTVGCVNYDCDINFYEPLKDLFGNVIRYNYLERINQIGRKKMNNEIIEIVKQEQPNYVFLHSYRDQITFKALDQMKQLNTKVVVWFSDDHWRFDNYSRFIAKHVFCSITTSDEAFKKYKDMGLDAIKSQWAANEKHYKPSRDGFEYEVSFVGQKHGIREPFINFLKKEKVPIQVFGRGWNRYVEFEKIISIFSRSKINLNISASSRNSDIKQIKGRVFEVPMCGGFLLTDYVSGLEEHFVIGKEIECYENERDAVEKIRYYLKHEAKRVAIAKAGYEASLQRHTWRKRLTNIFQELNTIEYSNQQWSIVNQLSNSIDEFLHFLHFKIRDRCKGGKFSIFLKKILQNIK